MSIIISKNGTDAKKIDKSDFAKEDELQEYIHKNPESIPVYEIQEDKKLFVVAREFPTESGPIDALAVDKDGDIYIVETKLFKNPDKRTVVAQALDYGASLWKHMNDFAEFQSLIDKNIEAAFQMSFSEKAKEFFNLDEEQLRLLLDSTQTNLRDGNLKFVVLMDTMGERLKDLIIYVNQNSQFDIYAVQMEYYKFEKYEIMIPKLFGVEVKKNIRTSQNIWNKEKFFNELRRKVSEKAFDYMKTLYNLTERENLQVVYGKGNVLGYFSAKIKVEQKTIEIVSVSTKPEFYFLCDKEFETGEYKELRIDFAKEGGETIPDLDKFNDTNNYWRIDLESLNKDQFAYLMESLTEIIQKIKKGI